MAAFPIPLLFPRLPSVVSLVSNLFAAHPGTLSDGTGCRRRPYFCFDQLFFSSHLSIPILGFPIDLSRHCTTVTLLVSAVIRPCSTDNFAVVKSPAFFFRSL